MYKPTLGQRIRTILFYISPHHLISRLAFAISHCQTHLSIYLIKFYISLFDVDVSEAVEEDLFAYKSFNAFFTRALKPEARPICEGEKTLVAPCDGIVMQLGQCEEGRILQAKSREYSVRELLADHSGAFDNGKFCTFYLSPKHYHRVHMPIAGTLESMTYVPGRLFSVAPYATYTIDRLYARNERLVCVFNTQYGRVALVFVGAINVAAIETVWSGLVTPRSRAIECVSYKEQALVELDKGQECGRFNMGSTVVMLLENKDFQWNPVYYRGEEVRMGAEIANLNGPGDADDPEPSEPSNDNESTE